MKHKMKKTKKLIKKLKLFWKEQEILTDKYLLRLYTLERKMSKELKIKDMEFFFSDNSIVGIGNVDRSMELIYDSELK